MPVIEGYRVAASNVVPLRSLEAPDFLPQSLIMIGFDNRHHLVEAYGEAIADEVSQAIYHRASASCTAAVSWFGVNRIDILFYGDSREVAGECHAALERMLGDIARPVATSGGIVLPQISVAVGAGGANTLLTGLDGDLPGEIYDDVSSLLATVRQPADAPERSAHWREAYRADMTKAVQLYGALASDELLLAWQPIVDAHAPSAMLYQEALLRCVSLGSASGAEHGLFGNGASFQASELLEPIERLGLARALDAWVVRATITALRAHPSLRLGCNISAQSARADGWWVSILADLSADRSLASRLVIEITETATFSRIGLAVEFSATLRRLGCTIAIDDFGVGRAAFRDIVALDPGIVKIDASFLRWASSEGLREGAGEELRHLIGLARCRGREVVMEGVETERMRAVAMEAGARWLQGFGFAAPRLARPFRIEEHYMSDHSPERDSADWPETLELPSFLLEEHPHEREKQEGSFFRGLVIGLPISLLLWAGLYAAWRWLA